MDNKHYLLGENHEIIVEEDLITWAKAFGKLNRVVKQENVGDSRVSTVFLGLDYNFSDGEPLLFETMIFGGEHDQYQERCSTWEQAEKMHQKTVELVKSSQK